MASLLTNLQVNWASLVDEPANKGARIMLFKRDETAALLDEIEKAGRKMSGSRLTRLKTATENLMSILTEVDEPKEEEDMADKAEKSVPEVDAVELTKRLDELNKRLADAETRAELAEKRAGEEIEKREIAACVEIAKGLDGLPIKADEFGPVLRAIRKGCDAATVAEVERVLKAASEIARTGKVFGEVGKAGGEQRSALERINSIAADLVSKGVVKTNAEGIVKAAEQNPALYTEYLAERSARA